MTLDHQQFERALEACASEAIHQIGHVQPHGGLLAFSGDTQHQIRHVSLNIVEFVGKTIDCVLNQPIASLFEPSELSQIEALIATLEEQATASGVIFRRRGGASVDLMLHAYKSDDMLVLEMERHVEEQQEARLADLLLQTQQTMLRTDAYFETGPYFDLLVQLVRSLTGYDSVMVYRFDSHWNGEIIAQSRVEAAPSYLGMHFPASDIPAQARRLYTTNLVRVVADVDATPIAIIPALAPISGRPLDLTYSALRSLSPIHIEYLRNIGVHASMVISLMQGDRLWGLVACHHLSPKAASMGLREAAILISRLVSTRLSAIEAIEQRRLTDRANLIVGELLRVLPLTSVSEILLRLMPELQALLSASAMIVIVEGKIHLSGDTPPHATIQQLLDWLAANPKSEVVSSDFLGHDCPDLATSADTVAGILATPPSPDMRNCIIWVRKEKPRSINWAGKYEEGFIQNDAGNYRLTPRKSFEIWRESWSGRSSPWTPVEVGVAAMLALAVPESLSSKQLLEEMQALQRQTEAELRLHRDHLEDLVRERTLSLSIAKEAAESASRAKTAFISTVSHELRTPMNGIMGGTRLALRRTEDPKQLDYLGMIEQSSTRLLSIINDMIDISELEAERLSLKQVEFKLGEVVEHVCHFITPLAHQKNLMVNLDTEHELSEYALYGDRERLGQILLNLAENAVRFTQTGSITLRTQATLLPQSEISIRFEVQDSGIGIRPDARSRIFTAFEQADNSHTRQFGGTGLGLAICKRLVRMMNGDIGVDSTEGLGSTFWFHVRLPVVAHARQNTPG